MRWNDCCRPDSKINSHAGSPLSKSFFGKLLFSETTQYSNDTLTYLTGSGELWQTIPKVAGRVERSDMGKRWVHVKIYNIYTMQ